MGVSHSLTDSCGRLLAASVAVAPVDYLTPSAAANWGPVNWQSSAVIGYQCGNSAASVLECCNKSPLGCQ